jgi:ABC-type phosphate transport system auxiliary subunit
MSARKKYRPRPVMTDPLSLLRPASPAQRNAVILRFLTALESMAKGDHPGEAEWRDLSDAINTVETLAVTLNKLQRSEVMPIVNAAIEGMVLASRRFKSGHGMRLDAAGLEALRTVVDIYRQCCEGLTEREMCMAQAITQRRVNELLNAKKPSREVVAV